MQLDPENGIPEHLLQRGDLGRLPAVLETPDVHQPLERPDQEDARAAGRVQNPLLAAQLVIRQGMIEQHGGQDGRRIERAVAIADESLIEAADDLDGKMFERILLPEISLVLKRLGFDQRGESLRDARC